MSDHTRDAARLPLRAMVMVLLFLGVIFLLVGFQAMGSSGDGDDDSDTTLTTVTTTSAPATSRPAAKKADVRVYNNVSDQEDATGWTVDELRNAGWNVTEVDDLSLPDVTATTVYFGEADDEQHAADAVGQLLHAPVQPRIPDLVEQPPGVIVVIAR